MLPWIFCLMRLLNRLFHRALLLPVVALSVTATLIPARAQLKPINAPPDLTPKEIEMGNKSVQELEKTPKVKLLDGAKDATSKALLAKLNDMATTLGKVSDRPLIKYNVKVLEDPDVNAFTLPGGHIYMSRGLLDLASSDDEIAAVIAHEIGHNVRMHVLRGQEKEKPLQWLQIAAMLAMLKGGQTGVNIAQIAPYILTGVVNKYSIGYEEEADACAIEEMRKTSYNPSAMVTFMQKLADEEKRRPEVQLGIYQDHPVSDERVQSALDAMKRDGIAYTPRAVTGANEALVVEKEDRISVVWDTQTIFEFAAPKVAAPKADSVKADVVKPVAAKTIDLKAVAPKTAAPKAATTIVEPEKTPAVKSVEVSNVQVSSTGNVQNTPPAVPEVVSPVKKRARTSAARLNNLMRANLRLYEVSVNADGDEATIAARGQVLARATLADAKLQNMTPLTLAQSWKTNLQRLFWKESINGSM